jgi:hypothetical protein
MPLARTSAEAHLFMDLRPCRCGETAFARDSSVVVAGDDLATRYAGPCARCGVQREFLFRLPEHVRPPRAGEVDFGGDEPSELLDPGEWLKAADAHAGALGDRQALATAFAAVGEVLKFIPPGASAVPPEAFRTYPGQSLYAAEPGRFRRDRLIAVREAYRELLVQAR